MFHHRKPFLMAALMAVAAASAQAQMPASGEASAQADGAARQKTASHDGKAGRCHARMAERHAKRMAALKERLKISPAQEDAWNQFASAMQPPAALTAPSLSALRRLNGSTACKPCRPSIRLAWPPATRPSRISTRNSRLNSKKPLTSTPCMAAPRGARTAGRMANHAMNATAAKAARAVQKPDSGVATALAPCRLMAPMAARRAADAGGPCRPLAFML